MHKQYLSNQNLKKCTLCQWDSLFTRWSKFIYFPDIGLCYYPCRNWVGSNFLFCAVPWDTLGKLEHPLLHYKNCFLWISFWILDVPVFISTADICIQPNPWHLMKLDESRWKWIKWIISVMPHASLMPFLDALASLRSKLRPSDRSNSDC